MKSKIRTILASNVSILLTVLNLQCVAPKGNPARPTAISKADAALAKAPSLTEQALLSPEVIADLDGQNQIVIFNNTARNLSDNFVRDLQLFLTDYDCEIKASDQLPFYKWAQSHLITIKDASFELGRTSQGTSNSQKNNKDRNSPKDDNDNDKADPVPTTVLSPPSTDPRIGSLPTVASTNRNDGEDDRTSTPPARSANRLPQAASPVVAANQAVVMTRRGRIIDKYQQREQARRQEKHYFDRFSAEPLQTYLELRNTWITNPEFPFPGYLNILMQIEEDIKKVQTTSPDTYLKYSNQLYRARLDIRAALANGAPFATSHQLISQFIVLMESMYLDPTAPLQDLSGREDRHPLWKYFAETSGTVTDWANKDGLRYIFTSQMPTLRYFNETWVLGNFSALFYTSDRNNAFDGHQGGPASMVHHDTAHQTGKEMSYQQAASQSLLPPEVYYQGRVAFIKQIYANIDAMHLSNELVKAVDLVLFQMGHELNIVPTRGHYKSYLDRAIVENYLVSLSNRVAGGEFGDNYRSDNLQDELKTAAIIIQSVIEGFEQS